MYLPCSFHVPAIVFAWTWGGPSPVLAAGRSQRQGTLAVKGRKAWPGDRRAMEAITAAGPASAGTPVPGDGAGPHGGAVARTGPVHAAARDPVPVPPAAPRTAAASISSRSAAAA